jgi:regulator of protease activity HflC (stomatin/prohibitin superfamily)
MTTLIIVIAVFLGVIAIGGIASARIIREYERAVVFRLGRSVRCMVRVCAG